MSWDASMSLQETVEQAAESLVSINPPPEVAARKMLAAASYYKAARDEFEALLPDPMDYDDTEDESW